MIKGIDISHHSTFTLSSFTDMVDSNELYFCFVKATEGATLKDEKFAAYWQISRNAGLLCGAYHFLRPLTDPVLQANNFITQYKTVNRTGTLPPVVDIEWATVGKDPNKTEQWALLAPSKRIPFIKSFLFQVEQELHVKPIIYTATAFWKEFLEKNTSTDDKAFFSTFPLWHVNLNGTTPLPAPWTKATFVQTHFGELAKTTALFDKTDQDGFTGTLKDMLNATLPGFTIARGFPRSFIVQEIQQALKSKNLLQENPDGLFGQHTENAVTAFQQKNGLFANGIIDAQTWNKLL